MKSIQKNILDFNVNSPINSYNYTSFIGGVMFAKDMDRYPYYLSNHIILLCNDLFDVSCDDMIMYEDENVFERKGLINTSNDAETVKDEIIKMLNKGFYASVTVDEYDIPNRYFYQNETFYHDMLIYGYDISENVFYTAGYDNSNYFTVMKHEIGLISKSVSKCLIERKSKPHLHLFKCKDDINIGFDIVNVKDKLKKYINSEPMGVKRYKGVYGISAYEELINKFCYSCDSGNFLRKASFSMLYEHKKLMLDRLAYIFKYYTDFDHNIMLSYENILKESKNIQMSSLKYQISKNEKTKIKIIDKLKALADQELNAIEKVIRII